MFHLNLVTQGENLGEREGGGEGEKELRENNPSGRR